MAGRFPLYTDADVRGPIVRALIRNGWDVLRAIDAFPERTRDPIHFEAAARANRVLVANDTDRRVCVARRRLAPGRGSVGRARCDPRRGPGRGARRHRRERRTLLAEGIGGVMATHNLGMVGAVCREVLLQVDGRAAFQGPAGEAVARFRASRKPQGAAPAPRAAAADR